jgi:hypothetical protein
MKSTTFWVEETFSSKKVLLYGESYRHLQLGLSKLILPHASAGFIFGLLFEPEAEVMLG